jgi:signal transduction histidine kinase
MLSSKKAFVRYVSHEIRNPLNIVSLGLQSLAQALCTARPSASPFPDDSESSARVIVEDVSRACGVAIEMLNELLLLDKIEEGHMVLEKTHMNARQQVMESVSLFDVQVWSRRCCDYFSLLGSTHLVPASSPVLSSPVLSYS